MKIHGWNIGGGVTRTMTGRVLGLAAHKQTQGRGSYTQHIRSANIMTHGSGPLFRHTHLADHSSMPIGSRKLTNNFNVHTLHVNRKKAAIVVGGGVAAAGIGYAGYKVYKRHQAQAHFKESVRHHA